MERIIPLDRIPKGSNVIIYGAGKLGLRFYNLNQKLEWFKTVAVVDLNYGSVRGFPCKVMSPDSIGSLVFDYILLAISSCEERYVVFEKIVNYGVDRNKIVFNLNWYRDRSSDIEEVYIQKSNDNLQIAMLMGGALGDNIVDLKLYQEIEKIAPDSIIDIYTSYLRCPDVIYGGKKCIRSVRFGWIMPETSEWEKYDLIIELEHAVPRIRRYNRSYIEKKNKKLANSVRRLLQYNLADKKLESSVGNYKYRVWIERARILGQNRFSMIGVNGAFDVTDKKVDIILREDYRIHYEDLNLGRQYITFNFGADNLAKDVKIQTKMWPIEYHKKLNLLIKEKFPDVSIIQLGGREAHRVEGADRYVFGESFETIKYVLKNALCHIDCEGGLVHMATQLGTKCFVMFGPTPIWYYGYECNENFKSKVCTECIFLSEDWYTNCQKYDRPECMYSIKPTEVFERVNLFLKGIVE